MQCPWGIWSMRHSALRRKASIITANFSGIFMAHAVIMIYIYQQGEWPDWFLGCLDRAFDGTEEVLGHVLHKARFWEVMAMAVEIFSARQRAVINRLLDGFERKLTSSKWAKLTKVSSDTALRDITDLVDRGA